LTGCRHREGQSGRAWQRCHDRWHCRLAKQRTAGTYNKQIAVWLDKIGGEKVIYHDDPNKTASVRQFFKDSAAAVAPAYATPAEPADGYA
jgi:hypothetical protein